MSAAAVPSRSTAAPVSPATSMLVLVMLLSALGELSGQLYIPSLTTIAQSFGVGKEMMQHTLTAYVLAFGAGQLVYGPLSDRFGRRPVLIGGLAIYWLATLGCFFAPSVDTLIVARLAQGLGVCAALVLARAVTRDVWGVKAGPVMAVSTLVLGLGIVVAPVVGGFLSGLPIGWRANFLFLLLIGTALLAYVVFALPETNLAKDPLALRPKQVLLNYGRMLRDRTFMRFSLLLALIYGGLFAFISTGPLYFIGRRGFTPGEYGLCFGGIVLGMCLGIAMARIVSPKWGLVRTVWVGLVLFAIGAVTSLLLSGHSSPWALLLPELPMTFGAGLILPNAVAGGVIPQATRAGLAAGLLGFLQMLGGALLGYVAVHVFDGSLFTTGLVQLAAIVLAMALFHALRLKGSQAVPGVT